MASHSGYLYAFDAATGVVAIRTRLPSGTNAPVAIDGDYLIAASTIVTSGSRRPLIIAFKLGATGKLPGTLPTAAGS